MLAKISSEEISTQIDGVNFEFEILDANTQKELQDNKVSFV